MTVYISGKITDDKNYRAKFAKAKTNLEAQNYNVINPADVGEYTFLTYEQLMHIDFALIDCVDAIFMLKDWQSSKGARMELQYAADFQKEIIYEDESTREPNFPIVYGHPIKKVL